MFNLNHKKQKNYCIPIKLKGLSDLRSGGVFGEWDYNEGLKFGVFSYLFSSCKCFGPNKTNFMDFGQIVAISQLFYKK